MDNIAALLSLINRVVEGDVVTEEEVQSVTWASDDLILQKVSNRAWVALRRFVDDSDIRAGDKEYESSLRDGLRLYREELNALLHGEDPYRRRSPWLKRAFWRLGLVGD